MPTTNSETERKLEVTSYLGDTFFIREGSVIAVDGREGVVEKWGKCEEKRNEMLVDYESGDGSYWAYPEQIERVITF